MSTALTETLPQPAARRILGIDALRGLVMVFMLADHVRETFLLHLQVSDPMDVAATPPTLFVSRLIAHLCAPVFVFLTGLSAYLYASRQAAATFGETATGFFNVTKYPPSLLFALLTLGLGLLLVYSLERRLPAIGARLAVLGAAPMFFYILHLVVLQLIARSMAAAGFAVRMDGVWQVWTLAALLTLVLYPAVRAFAAFKARRRDLAWLKYL